VAVPVGTAAHAASADTIVQLMGAPRKAAAEAGRLPCQAIRRVRGTNALTQRAIPGLAIGEAIGRSDARRGRSKSTSCGVHR
jgi:hypothetical protein